jgi:hypothetical protein
MSRLLLLLDVGGPDPVGVGLGVYSAACNRHDSGRGIRRRIGVPAYLAEAPEDSGEPESKPAERVTA